MLTWHLPALIIVTGLGAVLGLSYGAFALGFGISFAQALAAGIVGIVFSFLLVGFVAPPGEVPRVSATVKSRSDPPSWVRAATPASALASTQGSHVITPTSPRRRLGAAPDRCTAGR
ncbi:hypothetical protein [Pseudonocardia sp. DSM 110487]|uniref:hypothetical protein n=1 Tax=Pseudonocardia sp. DSM 110487 TaxID=2865833 RepID=UPI0021045705|nr:hypothetical protein [Pseudonocardia sp. DSM 110487]